MSTPQLISQEREITDGPRKFDLMMAIINQEVIFAQLKVRGVGSDCNCWRGNSCEKCQETSTLFLRICGFDHTDILDSRIIFRGFVSPSSKKLEHLKETAKYWLQGKPEPLPEGVEYVYGVYDPEHKTFGRIMPCHLGPYDTSLAMYNDCLVRLSVWEDVIRQTSR